LDLEFEDLFYFLGHDFRIVSECCRGWRRGVW
jgi:hypothetical protein